jgi:S-adenosylmethionine hydrolase
MGRMKSIFSFSPSAAYATPDVMHKTAKTGFPEHAYLLLASISYWTSLLVSVIQPNTSDLHSLIRLCTFHLLYPSL